MSVPTNPAHAIFALVVMGIAIFLVVKTATVLFVSYLGIVGFLYMHGYRGRGSVALVIGGMALGGLGWLTFQGLMSLAGWLL